MKSSRLRVQRFKVMFLHKYLKTKTRKKYPAPHLSAPLGKNPRQKGEPEKAQKTVQSHQFDLSSL